MLYYRVNLVAIFLFVLSVKSPVAIAGGLSEFTNKDRFFLRSLAIDRLEKPSNFAGNDYASSLQAAQLGKALFYDTNLSANGSVACSSCHQPDKYFTDGLPQAVGLGKTRRNTPSILVSAHSPWQFWDGRRDSMWAQALGPLEDAREHGISREELVKVIAVNYQNQYETVFGVKLDPSNIDSGQVDTDLVFVNVGKALMAYQYQLRLLPSNFDKFVTHLGAGEDKLARAVYSDEQIEGLKIFVGKGNCVSCHNGPMLTNFEFHNVGVPEFDKAKVDLGRYLGVKQLAKDEFTCLSRFSSTPKENCLEMNFLKTDGPELVGAFKTPSLRNVAKTGPYMHSGQFNSLLDVVNHYNKPKPPYYDRKQHPNRPHFDILPLGLTEKEKHSLVSFLETLTSPIPLDDPWWPVKNDLPSSISVVY
ncbi:MAG: cytochrome C peroxidase [Oligoflexales bacterium]|nr:cytochrome C peroxidase [Oligoflexales bacterium]